MAKVLFIVSGATYWVMKDGTRYATGYWAEEFANPYKIVTDAGHDVVVATPVKVAFGTAVKPFVGQPIPSSHAAWTRFV